MIALPGPVPCLILTAGHRGDQEFYEIGRIEAEVSIDTLFDNLPVYEAPTS